MSRVVLHVRFDVRPEFRDTLLALLEDVAHGSRREPGCLRYDISLPADEPNSIVLWEEYVDQAALDAHMAAPHLVEWRRGRDALPPDAFTRRVERLEAAPA